MDDVRESKPEDALEIFRRARESRRRGVLPRRDVSVKAERLLFRPGAREADALERLGRFGPRALEKQS